MFNVHGSGDTSGFGGLRLPAYVAAPAERPYGGWFDEFTDDLLTTMGERGIEAAAIQQVTVDRGEITYYVRREDLLELCRALRDDESLRFELCSSVSGVDYGVDVPQRLHSVYHLTSMTYRRRIRLEVCVDVDDAHVPSVVEVYPTADWQERETWDMFGIVYDGHPGADPDPHAGRLGRSPPAQGLPARRDPGGVQGRGDPAARPAEVVLMTRQTRTRRARARPPRDRSTRSPAATGTRSSRTPWATSASS